MDSLKSKKVLVYVVMGLLSLASVYSEFNICTLDNSLQSITELVFVCVLCALTFYYAISNFKVPHGNLLKYLFLAFSVMCLVGFLCDDAAEATFKTYTFVNQILRGLVVIFSAYIAGRLDRIKENTILLVIGGLILLTTSVINIVLYKLTDFTLIIFMSSFFILWVNLTIAYIFRYYGHKEAGLEDK